MDSTEMDQVLNAFEVMIIMQRKTLIDANKTGIKIPSAVVVDLLR